MKGKRVRIGCAAASLLMGISGTYAYYRSSVETINKIAVGDVNIGIWEYEEDGDGEKKYEGPENGIVLPSQVISKIPRITNYAEPCYVRVKPVFDEEETQDYRLGEEDLLSCYICTARRHLCRCPLQCSEGRGNGNKKATAHFCTIASCNFPRYQFTSFIPPLKPQLFPNFSPKRKAKRISF